MEQKITPYVHSKKTLLVGLIVCMAVIILFLPIISAYQFDNVKNYNPELKEITIENALGLGGDVATIKLTSPLNFQVPRGYQKVAEFDLTYYMDDNGGLDKIDFFDIKNSMNEINREFDYKIKEIEEYEVNDYETVCEDNKTGNGKCVQNIIGTHTEERIVWNNFDKNNLKKEEKVTIGIFTDVQVGDVVEWIPTFYGVEIDEWASWTENLNVDIVQYYNFDKSSGTALPDVTGNYGDGELQNMTDDDWVAGILGNALTFDGTNDLVLLDNARLGKSTTYTYNVWFDTLDKLTAQALISEASDSNSPTLLQIRTIAPDTDGFVRGDAGTYVMMTGTTSTDTGWHMVTLTRDGDVYNTSIDGVFEATDTATIGSFDSDVSLIGAIRIVGLFSDFWKGKIDEVGLWNRTLSQAEIVDLYNGGTGITFLSFDNSPIITLNSPSSANYTTPQNITINFTASDDINLVNVSLYVNGVLNQTNATGINNSNYLFNLSLEDGDYTIYGTATDNKSQETNSDSIQINIDTGAPVVNITYPPTTIEYGVVGNNETLNWTVTDANLDTCWYNYNGTNTTVTCGDNTTYFIIEAGNTNLTFYANDTYGSLASEFVGWSYNITENSQTYPTNSIESSRETYTSNLTYNSSIYNIISGSLHLNGTSYIGTRSGSGTSAIFTTNATMPSIATETNFTAYWTISLTNEDGTIDYNLTSHNVTVSIINLTLCDASNNVAFWNFTILNESNAAEINSTLEVTFTVKQTGSTSENIFSYSDVTGNNSQYDFCISPGTESYTIDTNIKLTKSGFVDKFYDYGSVVVTNSTREDNLYMMATADSTSFIVHTTYTSGEDLTDAEVKVQRYYPGTNEWLTTEILTTNDEGEAVGHFLSEDADYRFQVYLDGVSLYNSSSTKIVCATAPCTVTLVIPTTFLTGYETYENLVTTLTYSTTTNTFTYIYEDTSGEFTNARLWVRRYSPANATIISPCNTTKTTTSGVITCDITGQVNGTYMAVGYITREDEFVSKIIYGVYGSTFYDSISIDGILWGFFIIIGVVMLGIARPSLAIIFSIISLMMVSLLGLVNIGVVSIVAVLAIGIILLMRVGRE